MNVLKFFTIAATVLSGFVNSGLAQDQQTKAIDWEGNVFKAYSIAQQQNKPLVIFFHKDYCEECRGRCQHCAPVEGMLKLPECVALADKAVWVWQTMGIDDENKNVKRLIDDLEVDRVPAIYVLGASEKSLTLRGKIVGVAPIKLFVKQLRSQLENWPSNSASEKAETEEQDKEPVDSNHGSQASMKTLQNAGFFESLVNQNSRLGLR